MAILKNPTSQIGGKMRVFNWLWQDQSYRIMYEVREEGSPVLLLPAFSTVSTRLEMRGLRITYLLISKLSRLIG